MIDLLITGGTVITETQVQEGYDIAIHNGRIIAVGELKNNLSANEIIDADDLIVFPGLVDPHVHFREPGPNAEEDFETGTRAAAAGGVTTVLEQPVDTPPTTTVKRFEEKIEIIRNKSYVDYGLWGGVVPDNINELEGLAQKGACAFKGFMCSSDPVYPMIEDGELLEAMKRISTLDLILALHCENQSIINNYSSKLQSQSTVSPIEHVNSRPEVAELEAIQRAVLLATDSGVRLHILHLSCAKGAAITNNARDNGYPVTVETCPHYLVLTDRALIEYGPYAKCNPPLRDEENQNLLWEALVNGKIDCLVSDHSPYLLDEKLKGFEDIRRAPPGINSLELGLPLMLKKGVNKGRLSLLDLAKYMSTNPAKLFNLYPKKGRIGIGADADLVLIDPKKNWVVDSEKLQTKNKWSPFSNWTLTGEIVRTMLRGTTIYEQGVFKEGPGVGRFLNLSKNIMQ